MSISKLDKSLNDEVLEHVILEKAKILKGDHFLPKKKSKKGESRSSIWFYLIGLGVIGFELWYLYQYLMVKFPNLF